MNLFAYFGALLVAVLALSLPALCHKYHWTVIREGWRDPLRMFLGVLSETLGTVTVTYLFPVGSTPTTIPPTQTVMSQHNLMVVQVFMDTTDTIATITHNMNTATLSTSPAPSTSFNMPIVIPVQNNVGTVGGQVTVTGYATDTVGIVKESAANSSVTFTLYILRPWSPNL